MSIRFKFRSSLNFDTVEIGNRDSISVAELRSKIMRGKVSQPQQGFDLIFSDAVSGLEYKCDSQIPNGSSVTVKRVPSGKLPSFVVPIDAIKHVGLKESHNLNLAKTEPKNDFDDLGADLCPKPDSGLPDFNQELDQNNFVGNKKDDDAVDDAVIPGFDQHGNDRNILPIADELMESNKPHTSNFLTMQGFNLPLDLKCSLCKNFFTDAVMIPCCQHSFCEKCIHEVLFTKGMCPKCFSRKCTIADLLPNLSFRQAIEHFLESQMFDAAFENVTQKYVPDGESGIQANDVSCAITVAQRELEVPQSSCATGKGSNQVLREALYEQHQRNVPYSKAGSREFEDFAQSTDFQGENQPAHLEAKSHADYNAKRKGGFWFDSGAGGKSFAGHGRYRKGVRNCYSCGSSDHLMRDCPISQPNPMFQPGSGAFHGGMPGYASPYWNVSSFPPYTPYANMYNNPSMMLFNPSMVPVGPFAVPPYISSVGDILPGPGENMRMGNMEPPRLDHFGLQHCGNKRKKLSNENLEREQFSDEDGSSECDQHYSLQKSYHHKPWKDRVENLSHSDDSLAQRSGRRDQHKKYMHSGVYADERHEKSRHSFAGMKKRLSHVERSNSGKENKSRSTERHCKGRHKHHHRDSTKDNERKGHYDSDSSFGHLTVRDVKRRVNSDVQDSHRKHYNRSDYGFEPWTPGGRRAEYSEREAGQESSRLHAKHLRERHHGDRLQVVYGSNEDCRDDCHQKHRAY